MQFTVINDPWTPPKGAPEDGYVWATKTLDGKRTPTYGVRVVGAGWTRTHGPGYEPVVTHIPGGRVTEVLRALGVDKDDVKLVGRFVRRLERLPHAG